MRPSLTVRSGSAAGEGDDDDDDAACGCDVWRRAGARAGGAGVDGRTAIAGASTTGTLAAGTATAGAF
ncbi:MAG TPA: hypothetical protein VF997_10075, partial [Polyangia bacterium]